MKIITILLATLIAQNLFGQITGTVTEAATGNPIPYVNVWVKNTLIGATTGKDGKFTIKRAKIGDTIHTSSLGYSTVEFLAKEDNRVGLKSKINELDEVVLTPMLNTAEFSLKSFTKIKKNRSWYNNGHYSLARFYAHNSEYDKTPFIGKISLITLNAKKEDVIFRIRLVQVGPNGEPSEVGLTDNILLDSKKGSNEVIYNLNSEKIIFPKNGFFIIVDRLNLEENESFNKNANMNILQPAIGMERTDQKKNTWLGFGGKWMSPSEMISFIGTNGNIAVNVLLTN